MVPCTSHSISTGAVSSQEPPSSLYPEAEELPGNRWGQPKSSSRLDAQPRGIFPPLSLCPFPPHFASPGAAGGTVRVNSSAGLCGYTDEGVYASALGVHFYGFLCSSCLCSDVYTCMYLCSVYVHVCTLCVQAWMCVCVLCVPFCVHIWMYVYRVLKQGCVCVCVCTSCVCMWICILCLCTPCTCVWMCTCAWVSRVFMFECVRILCPHVCVCVCV